MTQSQQQRLFNFFYDEFDLLLMDSDFREIENILSKGESIRKTHADRIWKNIEKGISAAKCECSGDAQIIPCPAGENCKHENNYFNTSPKQ